MSEDDSRKEYPDYLDVFFLGFVGLAIFGFLFNISKLTMSTTFTVFFFDALLISYTNLLAIPLLVLVTFTKFQKKIVFPRRDIWSYFLLVPFGYILIVLLFRVLEKIW